ncbi:MAG: MBL fold metallo-hydrolase [Clostridiales bacterium]|jgi:glyoxylase-like metal-dependent hydrolase (beta-lactamase superfamily II)|nr:MBL fold metallo-hydrolase [Clostridiales bacterium]
MRIAENIEMLEILQDKGTLHLTLIWDDNEAVLFDTGLPGQLDLIRAAVENAGVPFERIKKVILTHQDMDHVGCAKLFSEQGVELFAHEDEAAYIQGDKMPVKLAALKERLPELSAEGRAFYERLSEGAKNHYVKIDRLLKDGEILPFCGGMKIIHTPGHTPGHIAILLQSQNVLVAGDAANIDKSGILSGAEGVNIT